MLKAIAKWYFGLILASMIVVLYSQFPVAMTTIILLVLALSSTMPTESVTTTETKWGSDSEKSDSTPTSNWTDANSATEPSPNPEQPIDACITRYRSAKLFEIAAGLERIQETKSQLDHALEGCFNNGGYTHARYANLADKLIDGIVESAVHALKFESCATDRSVFANSPCVRELESQIENGKSALTYALDEIMNMNANSTSSRNSVTRSASELSNLAKRASRLILHT